MELLLSIVTTLIIFIYSFEENKYINCLSKNEVFCDSLFTDKINKRYIKGKNGFLKDVGKSTEYPSEAIRNGVVGYSVIDFFIDKNGSIQKVAIISSMGYGIDEEVERGIKSTLGNWNQSHEETYFRLMIIFSIGDKKIVNYHCENSVTIIVYH